MLNFGQLYENNALALGLVILVVVVFPVLAGTLASIIIWKRKLGRVIVQRLLVNDSKMGRPIWKLVTRSSGRPVMECTIRCGSNELLWEGIDTKVINIGQDGIGLAAITYPVEQNTIVTVKSGSFPIFRSTFAKLEEIITNL